MFKIWFCLPLLLASAVLRADYAVAVAAHDKKDYATAFAEFRKSAELGDYDSQRNLAAMYFNGEGIVKDKLAAYAWFSLANDQLLDKVEIGALLTRIDSTFSDDDRILAKSATDSLRELYGSSALKLKAMPLLLSSGLSGGQTAGASDTSVTLSPDTRLTYPKAALTAKLEGYAVLSFLLDTKGYPLGVQIDAEKPAKSVLGSTLIAATKTWKVLPHRTGQSPLIRYSYAICFKLKSGSVRTGHAMVDETCPDLDMNVAVVYGDTDNATTLSHYSNVYVNDDAAALQAAVDSGSAVAQRINAHNLEQLSNAEKRDNSIQITESYRVAAINGDAIAQYHLGIRLLLGQGCLSDVTKAQFWLNHAADQGNREAQLQLGTMALLGQQVPQNIVEANRWLEPLAKQGYSPAAITLANYYSGSNELDKQQKALAYLSRLNKDDPATMINEARIYAHQKQFIKAVDSQSKAIAILNKLGVDTSAFDNELLAYKGSNLPVGN